MQPLCDKRKTASSPEDSIVLMDVFTIYTKRIRLVYIYYSRKDFTKHIIYSYLNFIFKIELEVKNGFKSVKI